MRYVLATLVALITVGAGCNGVTEDNLNKWMNTERGPDKIVAALGDAELEPGMRAVAARNLVRMDRWADVRKVLDETPTDARVPLTKALALKLWEDARIKDKMQIPGAVQSNAKDALYEIRQYSDDAGREVIDGYLVEWLAGYYEGRAGSGRVGGHIIVRAIGARAAEGLLAQARSILAAPPDSEGNMQKIGDNLLYGLALSGSKDAVGFVLDLAAAPSKDTTLQDRAMAALYNAYVKPVGIEPADAKALGPHVGRLSEVLKNPDLPGAVRNDAIFLVAAAGMPACLPVFVDMVSYPAQEESFRWIGVQQGIRCGKLDAIVPIAEALPPTGSYRRAVLAKYFWDEAVSLSPTGEIAARAEVLLGSQNPIARVSGVELLGMIKLRGRLSEDVKRIQSLAGDKTVLAGWWDKGVKTPPPTVGQRAQEVAKELQQAER